MFIQKTHKLKKTETVINPIQKIPSYNKEDQFEYIDHNFQDEINEFKGMSLMEMVELNLRPELDTEPQYGDITELQKADIHDIHKIKEIADHVELDETKLKEYFYNQLTEQQKEIEKQNIKLDDHVSDNKLSVPLPEIEKEKK